MDFRKLPGKSDPQHSFDSRVLVPAFALAFLPNVLSSADVEARVHWGVAPMPATVSVGVDAAGLACFAF